VSQPEDTLAVEEVLQLQADLGDKEAAKTLKKLQKQRKIDEDNATFSKRYEEAMKAWRKTHPSAKVPVYKDDDGRLKWANRKQRLAIAKIGMKQRKADLKRAVLKARGEKESA